MSSEIVYENVLATSSDYPSIIKISVCCASSIIVDLAGDANLLATSFGYYLKLFVARAQSAPATSRRQIILPGFPMAANKVHYFEMG